MIETVGRKLLSKAEPYIGCRVLEEEEEEEDPLHVKFRFQFVVSRASYNNSSTEEV
jgi:hypothetical protein